MNLNCKQLILTCQSLRELITLHRSNVYSHLNVNAQTAIKLNLLGGFHDRLEPRFSIFGCLLSCVAGHELGCSLVIPNCCPSQLMMIEVDDGSTVTTKDGNGEAGLNCWGVLRLLLIEMNKERKLLLRYFMTRALERRPSPHVVLIRTFLRPWPLPLQLEDHVVVPVPLELRHSPQSVLLVHE